MREQVEDIRDRIEKDIECLQGEPAYPSSAEESADVQINAPLALKQMGMRGEVRGLMQAYTLLNEVLDDGDE